MVQHRHYHHFASTTIDFVAEMLNLVRLAMTRLGHLAWMFPTAVNCAVSMFFFFGFWFRFDSCWIDTGFWWEDCELETICSAWSRPWDNPSSSTSMPCSASPFAINWVRANCWWLRCRLFIHKVGRESIVIYIWLLPSDGWCLHPICLQVSCSIPANNMHIALLRSLQLHQKMWHNRIIFIRIEC